MSRVSATGGFGGSSWEEFTAPAWPFPFPSFRAGAAFRQAGFEARGEAVLTGTWLANDGGTYYVRQHGDRVMWFGERRGFSNVLNATRSGNTIAGNWADVPKARASSTGELRLAVQDAFTLDRTEGSGGFGGSRWRRVQAIDLDVHLDTLILHATEDSGGDEPFLWTAFIKIDGDTFELAESGRAHATVVSTSGSHNNLTRREGLRSGSRLAIPPRVGRFSTVLKTLRGLDPFSAQSRDSTRFAFLVIAFDEDGTSDGAIEAGRNALVSTLQSELTTAIRRLRAPDPARLEEVVKESVRSAVAAATPWYDVPGWLDPDDEVGSAVKQFTFAELVGARGIMPLDLHFRKDASTAHYQITGSIRVDNGPVRPL